MADEFFALPKVVSASKSAPVDEGSDDETREPIRELLSTDPKDRDTALQLFRDAVDDQLLLKPHEAAVRLLQDLRHWAVNIVDLPVGEEITTQALPTFRGYKKTVTQIVKTVRDTNRPRSEKSLITVHALVLKTLFPLRTWPNIFDLVCNCGVRHGAQTACYKRYRANVNLLSRSIRKLKSSCGINVLGSIKELSE